MKYLQDCFSDEFWGEWLDPMRPRHSLHGPDLRAYGLCWAKAAERIEGRLQERIFAALEGEVDA